MGKSIINGKSPFFNIAMEKSPFRRGSQKEP